MAEPRLGAPASSGPNRDDLLGALPFVDDGPGGRSGWTTRRPPLGRAAPRFAPEGQDFDPLPPDDGTPERTFNFRSLAYALQFFGDKVLPPRGFAMVSASRPQRAGPAA